MDMMTRTEVAALGLADWRQLAQGLHTRYRVPDLGAATRFVTEVVGLGDDVGDHLRVTLGEGYADLRLLSPDALYRDDAGDEHVVEWVTQRDVDLAREVSAVAAEHGLAADPRSLTAYELGLDTARSAAIARFWAALLTGGTDAVGRGGIGDDVNDPSGQTPLLWFQDTEEHETPRQRFHLDVWVPPEVAEERIAAAVAAGGVVVDDGEAPSFVVLADADGNRACVCTSEARD